jgi:hypothetical protein
VLDQAKLDLDQNAIQNYLADSKLYAAQKIYKLGAFSKTYAQINVTVSGTSDAGVPQFIEDGSELMGVSTTGTPVHGVALGDTPAGSTVLNFLYNVVTSSSSSITTTFECG